MKGYVSKVLVVLLAMGLLTHAMGFPIVLGALHIFGEWLRALPAPTEHFSKILIAWAWPSAALISAWALRTPISTAASALAHRMSRDDIEVGNWLKVSSSTPLTTLDRDAVTEESGTAEADDVRRTEALLEFAGEADENAATLLNWIARRVGPNFDPEEFLTDARFVGERKIAYGEIVEGSGNG